MRFRLIYEGTLPSQSTKHDKNTIKQNIRRYFHEQLSLIWNRPPLSDGQLPGPLQMEDNGNSLRQKVKDFTFIPLISNVFKTVCHLDIIFLRPEQPGDLFSQGGDIDNRIKILFDGLRTPYPEELPKDDKPYESEKPFYFLLQDDKLITGFSVITDQLLKVKNPKCVILIVDVKIMVLQRQWNNFYF